MSKNILDSVLDREIQGVKQIPSVEDAVAMLTGKDKRSIPKQKYIRKQKTERSEKIAELKADHIDQIPEIDHISKIPEGFPEGTIMNDDQTLTLPDGRTIRKIDQGEAHEEVI